MQLSAENLAARRGEDLLFANISFSLGAGEALVLTGRNGSGKSTLLRVVAGLLAPEKGRVAFTGNSGESDRRPGEVSHYFGHKNAMKSELSVNENLAFWRTFLGDGEGGTSFSVDDAADAVGLSGITHLPFGYLSAGQQRRLAFAKLLVAYRPVWILDEPTASLDAGAEETFNGLMRHHIDSGGMIVAATHGPLDLDNAQKLQMTGFRGVPQDVW